MNIGVITWFDFENYGTKLQAIALQLYLKELGHNVKLLDILVPTEQEYKKVSYLDRFRKRVNYSFLKCVKNAYKDQLCLKSFRMKKIISDLCECTEKITDAKTYVDICNQFDLLVCGSDQIWNPNWYHPYYYADFPEIQTRKISYAPSMGIHTIPERKKNLIREGLKGFDAISVRETRTAELLQPLIGFYPPKVLDPTMLLSKSQWENLFDLRNVKCESYILCYFLSDNSNHWNAVKKFAKEKNMPLYVIPQNVFSFFQKGKICADAGVKEFLKLVKGAQYILTDSFHGTIFSIIFEKEFYLFERFKSDQCFSQNDRVVELTEQFNVKNRLLNFNCEEIVTQSPIDYNEVGCILKKWRLWSEHFLISAIKGEKK